MATTVNPGNVREFAKFVGELAEEWKMRAEAVKSSKTDGGGDQYTPATFPTFGKLPEHSDSGKQKYEQNVDAWTTSTQALLDALNGLKEACNKVADQYDTAEERNSADVNKIQGLLNENLDDIAGQQQQPTA
jgi:hypothetical protein